MPPILLCVALGALFALDASALRTTNQIASRRSIRTQSRLASPIDEPWVASLSNKGVVTKGVKLATFDGGLRGIVATEDIPGNSVAVTVPADLVIETNNNRPPTPFPEFCSQEFWSSSCKWDHRLALKLLHLVKNGDSADKEASRKSWIEQLPESFSTPLHWSEEDVKALQYASITEKIAAQGKEWRDFYARWQKDSAQASGVSYKELEWALECVNSRAFSGVYEGSSASERRTLFLFTGALTLVWPVLGLGTPEQSVAAAFLVGVSIFTRDFFFSRSAGLKRYVVCPYIDMFNHKSTCNSDVSYGYFSDSFELKTAPYKKGEQVFISYGRQSNDRLLQYYGFVDAENPYDSYDFGSGFIDLIIKYVDEISVKVPATASLSPQERLKTIASALRNTDVKMLSAAQSAQKKGPQSTAGDELNTRYFRTNPTTLVEGGNAALPPRDDSIIGHFDDITVRALRALYCTPEEWQSLCSSTGGQLTSLNALGTPLSSSTERAVATALRDIVRLELAAKPTSLDEDLALLAQLRAGTGRSSDSDSGEKKGFGKADSKQRSGKATVAAVAAVAADPSGKYSDTAFSAVTFRVEKKKLLKEALTLSA